METLPAKKDYQHTQGTTYYGHYSDHGTPGYHEAAPLPVETLWVSVPARRGKVPLNSVLRVKSPLA